MPDDLAANKKSFAMKTLLLSVLICLGATGVLWADPVIGFDDLPVTGFIVPAGYHLLNWSNMNYVNGVLDTPSGYAAGVVSSSNVVYNGNGDNAAISGELFDFRSAYVSAAWNDNLQFKAQGYIHGTKVYDQTNTLSATSPTLINFDFYGVDQVILASSGGTPHAGYAGSGTQFAMDNLSVQTYLPFMPSLITNGGFETGDFSGWYHLGDTNFTWVTNTPTYVHSGTYGVEIGPTGDGYLAQELSPTQIGQLYTVSFWLENEDTLSNNNFVVYWGGLPLYSITNGPAFAWTNIQLTVQATTLSEFLEFQFENTSYYFGFDDVSIVPVTLVSNGGFETGNFSGWTQSGTTGDNFVNGVNVRSGTYSAQLGAEDSFGYISQSITTQPGQTYLYSMWLDSPDGRNPNAFQPSWGGQILANNTNLTAFGWTNLHYNVLASEPNTTAQIGAIDNLSYLGFDEVSVLPVPILQNGGFELGDFTGWTASGNFEFCSVVNDTNYVHSGFYGGKFRPVGSLGYLSQTFATVPWQAYFVSLSFYNPTNMVDTPVTEFQVSWNGTILVDTTNLSFVGWFPYQFAVTADGTTSTLQLGFRDDSSFYLGVDDVSVSPLSAPVIETIQKTNDLVDLTWTGWPGYGYVPQYTTNLSKQDWQQLEGIFYFGITLPTTTTDTNPPDAQRFYRIRMLPPPLE